MEQSKNSSGGHESILALLTASADSAEATAENLMNQLDGIALKLMALKDQPDSPLKSDPTLKDQPSPGQLSRGELLRLQAAMDRMSRMMETLSNVIKTISDKDSTVSANNKG